MGQTTESLEQSREDSLAITEADGFVTASILTATPSDVLYSCFGHAFIRLQCPHYGLDEVYTYESESVANRVLSFFMGKLKMGMKAVPTERVLADYAKEGRGITEYILNIPLEKRKRLWQYLDEKVEEGMTLPYDYLNGSCAVNCLRAVRIAVLPDTISFGEWDNRFVSKSRRTLSGECARTFPWSRFFAHTVTGTEADENCAVTDKIITPSDLVDVMQKATLNGQPLLGKVTILVRQTARTGQTSWFTPVSVACILLFLSLLSCFWMGRPLSFLLLTLQLAFGLVLTYLVVFSSLPNISFSWLIVPLNPLPFILWHWRRWWLLPFALTCFCWSIVMFAHRENPLVDESYIIFVIALGINYMGQWVRLRNQTNQYK